MAARQATHAGSWYNNSKSKLDRDLDEYLSDVPVQVKGLGGTDAPEVSYPVPGARAIIAPHAGYAYSGPAAAWAYKALDWSKAKRIFLLGPSHHYYLSNCALSQCATYSTPLGPLRLDLETVADLRRTGHFGDMSKDADEEEHSLEMHLPYIYKMLALSFTDASSFPPLVPILVGNTKASTETKFGEILAPYLVDPGNYFVISSDFCHWGSRFRYTYYVPATGKPRHLKGSEAVDAPAIHESIAAVDKESWEAIETGEHEAFLEQVERTGNTVCGRHPIGVMMAAIEKWRESSSARENGAKNQGLMRFVRYERSSLVHRANDSSVSYCSAYAVL